MAKKRFNTDLKFEFGQSIQTTFKIEFLMEPFFPPDVIEAIKATIKDGQQRVVGSGLNTVIISPANQGDYYEQITIYVITGLYELKVLKSRRNDE